MQQNIAWSKMSTTPTMHMTCEHVNPPLCPSEGMAFSWWCPGNGHQGPNSINGANPQSDENQIR